eukprot:3975619-Alexandrium_andersonii.AAC.1
MSASLVGSEMCIRDRAKPAPETCMRVHMGASADVRVHAGAYWCTFAVSYTHLTLPTICSV